MFFQFTYVLYPYWCTYDTTACAWVPWSCVLSLLYLHICHPLLGPCAFVIQTRHWSMYLSSHILVVLITPCGSKLDCSHIHNPTWFEFRLLIWPHKTPVLLSSPCDSHNIISLFLNVFRLYRWSCFLVLIQMHTSHVCLWFCFIVLIQTYTHKYAFNLVFHCFTRFMLIYMHMFLFYCSDPNFILMYMCSPHCHCPSYAYCFACMHTASALLMFISSLYLVLLSLICLACLLPLILIPFVRLLIV